MSKDSYVQKKSFKFVYVCLCVSSGVTESMFSDSVTVMWPDGTLNSHVASILLVPNIP